MATKIRLARGGRKGRPFYSIVVANSTSPRDGKFIEKVGTYNPLLDNDSEKRIVLKQERVEHWLSVGAKPTDRVAILLNSLGLKGAAKFKPTFEPRKKGEFSKKAKKEAQEG